MQTARPDLTKYEEDEIKGLPVEVKFMISSIKSLAEGFIVDVDSNAYSNEGNDFDIELRS